MVIFNIVDDVLIEITDKTIEHIVVPNVKELGLKKTLYEDFNGDKHDIEVSCFNGCEKLKTIYISDNVEKINDFCFDVSLELESIEVSGNNKCFTSIEGVLYNKDKTVLIWYPFNKKGKKFILPNSVEEIAIGAFSCTSNLKEVILSNNLKKIGSYALRSCDNIESITIPSSVLEIGYCAFVFSSKLKEIIVEENNLKYSSIDGVLLNKDKTEIIYYPRNKKEEKYITPNTVKVIATNAFSICKNLKEVTLTNVEVIENENFSGTFLEKVFISKALKFIDNVIFDATVNLKEIIVDKENLNYSVVDRVLYDKELTELIKYPSSKKDKVYNLLDTTTYIHDNAFVFCNFLEEVILNEGLIEIGLRNFMLSNIKKINIPSTVDVILPLAFSFSNKVEINSLNEYFKVVNNKIVDVRK